MTSVCPICGSPAEDSGCACSRCQAIRLADLRARTGIGGGQEDPPPAPDAKVSLQRRDFTKARWQRGVKEPPDHRR